RAFSSAILAAYRDPRSSEASGADLGTILEPTPGCSRLLAGTARDGKPLVHAVLVGSLQLGTASAHPSHAGGPWFNPRHAHWLNQAVCASFGGAARKVPRQNV